MRWWICDCLCPPPCFGGWLDFRFHPVTLVNLCAPWFCFCATVSVIEMMTIFCYRGVRCNVGDVCAVSRGGCVSTRCAFRTCSLLFRFCATTVSAIAVEMSMNPNIVSSVSSHYKIGNRKGEKTDLTAPPRSHVTWNLVKSNMSDTNEQTLK